MRQDKQHKPSAISSQLSANKREVLGVRGKERFAPHASRLTPLFLLILLLLGTSLAQTLTILTHDSFTISEEVLETFTAETGIELELIQGGDAGETVNRAILTKARPLADLLFGVDNSLIARAKAADIFEPYKSPLLQYVPETYIFDETHQVTPIDVGFVNFNYDKAWFAERELEPPSNLRQLTEEAYRGLTVVPNPATSSPGLAFMLTTIDKFGDQWLEYWAALRDNDLLVTNGWSNAYYNSFSLYGGERPIVLSYATSPAAEVIFAEKELSEAPTGNLFCDECVYRQIEAVGILKGTDNREAAERFIDYMLSVRFQEDIPLNMFVYPVNEQATIPEVFEQFAPLPSAEQIAEVPSETIQANLATWLKQWTEVVLQGREPADVR